MKYDLVLFDYDGTLADSFDLIVFSFLETLKQHNYDVTEDYLRATISSHPLRETLNLLLKRTISDPEYEALAATHASFQVGLRQKYLRLYPGMMDVLRALKSIGVKMGLLSNRRQMSLEEHVPFLHIDQFFDTIVGFDKVGACKPDSRGVLMAMKDCGVTDSKRVLFVGDADADIGCAMGAGCDVCIVPYFREGSVTLTPTVHLSDLDQIVRLSFYDLGDDNQALTEEQFLSMMKTLTGRHYPGDSPLKTLFAKLDADGTGLLSWADFSQFYVQESESLSGFVDPTDALYFPTVDASQLSIQSLQDLHRAKVNDLILIDELNCVATVGDDGLIKFWNGDLKGDIIRTIHHSQVTLPFTYVERKDILKDAIKLEIEMIETELERNALPPSPPPKKRFYEFDPDNEGNVGLALRRKEQWKQNEVDKAKPKPNISNLLRVLPPPGVPPKPFSTLKGHDLVPSLTDRPTETKVSKKRELRSKSELSDISAITDRKMAEWYGDSKTGREMRRRGTILPQTPTRDVGDHFLVPASQYSQNAFPLMYPSTGAVVQAQPEQPPTTSTFDLPPQNKRIDASKRFLLRLEKKRAGWEETPAHPLVVIGQRKEMSVTSIAFLKPLNIFIVGTSDCRLTFYDSLRYTALGEVVGLRAVPSALATVDSKESNTRRDLVLIGFEEGTIEVLVVTDKFVRKSTDLGEVQEKHALDELLGTQKTIRGDLIGPKEQIPAEDQLKSKLNTILPVLTGSSSLSPTRSVGTVNSRQDSFSLRGSGEGADEGFFITAQPYNDTDASLHGSPRTLSTFTSLRPSSRQEHSKIRSRNGKRPNIQTLIVSQPLWKPEPKRGISDLKKETEDDEDDFGDFSEITPSDLYKDTIEKSINNLTSVYSMRGPRSLGSSGRKASFALSHGQSFVQSALPSYSPSVPQSRGQTPSTSGSLSKRKPITHPFKPSAVLRNGLISTRTIIASSIGTSSQSSPLDSLRKQQGLRYSPPARRRTRPSSRFSDMSPIAFDEGGMNRYATNTLPVFTPNRRQEQPIITEPTLHPRREVPPLALLPDLNEESAASTPNTTNLGTPSSTKLAQSPPKQKTKLEEDVGLPNPASFTVPNFSDLNMTEDQTNALILRTLESIFHPTPPDAVPPDRPVLHAVQGSWSVQAHRSKISQMLYVSELQTVVTCSHDMTIRSFDVEKLEQRVCLVGHTNGVNCMDWSKRFKTLVTGGQDHTVCIWNMFSQQLVDQLRGHLAPVISVAVDDSSGYIISIAADATMFLWDLRSHRLTQRTNAMDPVLHTPYQMVRYVPKAESILLVSRRLVELRFARRELVNMVVHLTDVQILLFSRTFQQLISIDMNNLVAVWDTKSGRCIFRFIAEHDTSIITATLDTRERRLITAAGDGKVKIWNPSRGTLLKEITIYVSTATTRKLFSLETLMNDGSDVLKKEGEEVKIDENATLTLQWVRKEREKKDKQRLASGMVSQTRAPITGDVRPTIVPSHLSFCTTRSRNQMLGVCGNNFMLTALTETDTSSFTERVIHAEGMTKHSETILTCCLIDNLIVAASDDGALLAWDADTGLEKQSLVVPHRQHQQPLSQTDTTELPIVFSSIISLRKQPGLFLTHSSDGMVTLWNLQTGKRLIAFQSYESTGCCAVDHDEEILVMGGIEGTITVFDLMAIVNAGQFKQKAEAKLNTQIDSSPMLTSRSHTTVYSLNATPTSRSHTSLTNSIERQPSKRDELRNITPLQTGADETLFDDPEENTGLFLLHRWSACNDEISSIVPLIIDDLPYNVDPKPFKKSAIAFENILTPIVSPYLFVVVAYQTKIALFSLDGGFLGSFGALIADTQPNMEALLQANPLLPISFGAPVDLGWAQSTVGTRRKGVSQATKRQSQMDSTMRTLPSRQDFSEDHAEKKDFADNISLISQLPLSPHFTSNSRTPFLSHQSPSVTGMIPFQARSPTLDGPPLSPMEELAKAKVFRPPSKNVRTQKKFPAAQRLLLERRKGLRKKEYKLTGLEQASALMLRERVSIEIDDDDFEVTQPMPVTTPQRYQQAMDVVGGG
ncbi:putative Pyrophosphatase PpaX [Blattamonas nauphoetae]|uniref:Pyrophosphatase PpaX n=1 Tax=Blattamonas nauphoetae TaxID=2049346 RepID=A0ABQ9YGT6_9EUKA|nr:putative Pyrophosphatase PpaX [Blattamonas nauphoetae]